MTFPQYIILVTAFSHRIKQKLRRRTGTGSDSAIYDDSRTITMYFPLEKTPPDKGHEQVNNKNIPFIDSHTSLR